MEVGSSWLSSSLLLLPLARGLAWLALLLLAYLLLSMLLLRLWLLLLALLLSASSILGLDGLELLLSVSSLLMLLDSRGTLSLLRWLLEGLIVVQLLLLLLHLLLHLRLGRLGSHLQLMLMLAHGRRLGLSSRHSV